MDKITILLQDKQTIEKLAANPEVQLRIKDAIIDNLGKRTMKISNVTKDIMEMVRSSIKNEFFTGPWSYTLKKEWQDVFTEKAREIAMVCLREEIEKNILKQLEEYDIEKDIREVAEKVIRDKFKK